MHTNNYNSLVDEKMIEKNMLLVIDTLPDAVDLLLRNINQELQNGSEKIKMTTSWICRCYKVDSNCIRRVLAPMFVVRTKLATVRNDKLNKYKTILAFYHQYRKNLE